MPGKISRLQYDYDYGPDGPLAALQERNARPDLPVMISPPLGWIPLVLGLDAQLAILVPDYQIAQVKEKFASLRYYIESWGVSSDDPRIRLAHEMIGEAEAESMKICQVCSGPGRFHGESYYYATLCDDHVDPPA